MSEENDELFDELGKDFNIDEIMFDHLAKPLANLYKGLKAQGLSIPEATALTLGFFSSPLMNPSKDQED